MHRAELAILGVSTAVWTLVALGLTVTMNNTTAANPGCFQYIPRGPECSQVLSDFAPLEQAARILLVIGSAAPWVLGVVLGSSAIAPEIEHGRVEYSWVLASSRLRWLLWQLLPVAAVVLLLACTFGGVGELLTRARLGTTDPGFLGFDERGVLLILRALAGFIVATTMGTLIGKILPTVLLSALLLGVLSVGLYLVLEPWRAAEASVQTDLEFTDDPDLANGMYLGQVAILPNGTVTRNRRVDLLPEDYVEGYLVLPSSEFWTWTVREAVIVGAAGAAGIVILVPILAKRRPR